VLDSTLENLITARLQALVAVVSPVANPLSAISQLFSRFSLSYQSGLVPVWCFVHQPSNTLPSLTLLQVVLRVWWRHAIHVIPGFCRRRHSAGGNAVGVGGATAAVGATHGVPALLCSAAAAGGCHRVQHSSGGKRRVSAAQEVAMGGGGMGVGEIGHLEFL